MPVDGEIEVNCTSGRHPSALRPQEGANMTMNDSAPCAEAGLQTETITAELAKISEAGVREGAGK